MTFASK